MLAKYQSNIELYSYVSLDFPYPLDAAEAQDASRSEDLIPSSVYSNAPRE